MVNLKEQKQLFFGRTSMLAYFAITLEKQVRNAYIRLAEKELSKTKVYTSAVECFTKVDKQNKIQFYISNKK